MSTIESVLHETRVFPPPEAFVKQANISGHGRLPGDVQARPSATSRASGRSTRANELMWIKPFTKTLDESNAPVLQVVPRRRAQRLGQLPRPAPAHAARQGRDHLRGRRRQGDQGHLQGALPPRLPVRQRAEVARHPEGRARARSTCRCRSRRWWRCRRARASAPRTRWCSAASRPRACRSAWSTPGAVAIITADGQFRGGKEIPLKPAIDEALGHGRLRRRAQRRRLQAHRLGRHDEGRARQVVARRGARPGRPTASPRR